MGFTIGIDLGTTNSAIASKKVQVSLSPNSEGDFLTPSWICATPPSSAHGDFVVGKAAKDLSKQYPKDTVFSIKRFMGRSLFEPATQKALKSQAYPYTVTSLPEQPEQLFVSLRDKLLSPEDLSAMILKKLIKDAEGDLKGKIDQAVITVPAYFSDRQKHCTRMACEKAGIKLLRLLAEPTAAALSFGLDSIGADEAKTVMVFDLGGGTFDISVLNIAGGHFMEVTKGGDMWLGGDDIDQLLLEHVLKKAEEQCGTKLPEGGFTTLIALLEPLAQARFRTELKEACEAAKIQLSTSDEAVVEVLGCLKGPDGGWIDIDVTISRTDFDSLIWPTIRRILAITKQILVDINFESQLIDEVIMVGGSSMIPAIQQAIKDTFGEDKVRVHPRPMYAIVEGAALLAHKLAGKEHSDDPSNLNLMGGIAHDYFLQLADGKRLLLAPRNSPLPFKVEHQLAFTTNSQMVARLRVLNDIDQVLENVGEFWFFRDQEKPLQSLNFKNAKLEIILGFEIDEDNLIKLEAWPKNKPTQKHEVVISKDFLSSRFFYELEKVISQIASKCSDNDETSAIAVWISRTIVASVNQLAQMSTPLDRSDQVKLEQSIYKKIETLESFSPRLNKIFHGYCFAHKIKVLGSPGLLESEAVQLNALVNRWDVALKNLNAVMEIEQIFDIFDKFEEKLPASLLKAVSFLMSAKEEFPKESKTIIAGLTQFGELRSKGLQSKADEEFNRVLEVLDRFDTQPVRHSGGSRFDRDVAVVQ